MGTETANPTKTATISHFPLDDGDPYDQFFILDMPGCLELVAYKLRRDDPRDGRQLLFKHGLQRTHQPIPAVSSGVEK